MAKEGSAILRWGILLAIVCSLAGFSSAMLLNIDDSTSAIKEKQFHQAQATRALFVCLSEERGFEALSCRAAIEKLPEEFTRQNIELHR